jgi:hypothetical protein
MPIRLTSLDNQRKPAARFNSPCSLAMLDESCPLLFLELLLERRPAWGL